MDFKQLESFIAVAETRSMTEAAHRRQLTQSAVSHQIKAIERELGSKLFIRHSNVLVLTEDGADFLAATREMFRKIQEGLDKIETLKGRVSGVLRVGVGSFIEPYVRRAGCQMMKDYPDLRFEVIIEKDHVLNEMLRAHKIDMAFTIRNSRSDENIESMPIVPIQIRAVVGETHPLAKKEKVTFEELKQHSVVMPEEDARSFAVIEKIIGQDLRDYVSKNGYHFTKSLSDCASKWLSNIDGTKHRWGVEEAAEALAPLPHGWTDGDAAYLLNWKYSDLMGTHAAITESVVIANAKAAMRDPDGYEGMVFLRYLTDIIGKGISFPWSDYMD